jgi:hypothetical protein
MTRRPPSRLPDPGLVLADGTVLPGAEALEAWHRAVLEHRRRVAAERHRFAVECAVLRERFGYAATMIPARATGAGGVRWYQPGFDELEVPPDDDQVVFTRTDGTWFAADARAYLPPCETEG